MIETLLLKEVSKGNSPPPTWEWLGEGERPYYLKKFHRVTPLPLLGSGWWGAIRIQVAHENRFFLQSLVFLGTLAVGIANGSGELGTDTGVSRPAALSLGPLAGS